VYHVICDRALDCVRAHVDLSKKVKSFWDNVSLCVLYVIVLLRPVYHLNSPIKGKNVRRGPNCMTSLQFMGKFNAIARLSVRVYMLSTKSLRCVFCANIIYL
jgi:hypothetical protein